MLEQYPEGEYPYNPTQSGEGLYPMEGKEKNPMDFRGNDMLALTTAAKNWSEDHRPPADGA